MPDVKGRTRGEMAVEYIDSFREAGIDAPGILRSMTVEAAALLGISGEHGTIRVGSASDLVATPLNAPRDIETLKRINFVMKGGQVYRRP